MKDQLVPDMDHLLLLTTLPLLLHTQARAQDTVIYQLDLRPRIIVDHHHQLLHHMYLHRTDMPLLPPVTLRQLEVDIILILIQIQLRVTVHHPQIPLLAMVHHPRIRLITLINLLPRHIILILILDTTHLRITATTHLLLLLDIPNLLPQDTPNRLLHLMIQLHRDRGIDLMYLLLLIHDDHLRLPRVKVSIDHHHKDRAVKSGICWLGLYVLKSR